MEDNIVVISFDRTQLSAVREHIPYLWALDLNYTKENIGKTITDLCTRGVGIDMSYGNVLPQLTRSMLDRGFPARLLDVFHKDGRGNGDTGRRLRHHE